MLLVPKVESRCWNVMTVVSIPVWWWILLTRRRVGSWNKMWSLTSTQLRQNMFKRKLPAICPQKLYYAKLFLVVSTRTVVPTSVGGTASTKGKQLAFNHDLFLYPLTSQEPPFCPLTENDARPRFTFQGISANTVLDIITGMPNNKAPGCDKIGVNVIKGVLPHILHVFTEIFNHFLTPGCFPKDWKIAEVASHPKHGDHEEPVTSTSCHCCQSYLRYWNALSTTSLSAVWP